MAISIGSKVKTNFSSPLQQNFKFKVGEIKKSGGELWVYGTNGMSAPLRLVKEYRGKIDEDNDSLKHRLTKNLLTGKKTSFKGKIGNFDVRVTI